MAIKVLYGSGRCDKLSYVYDQMKEVMTRHSYKECFVIVPEQYSLKTQEEVIKSLPSHGTNKIQVYSFQKLADWVFLKNGVNTRSLLDESGKTMLLRQLVQEVEEELVLLRGKLHRQGYLEELKSIFSEFEQYRLDSATLEEVIKKFDTNSLMYMKLKELHMIYDIYQKKLEESFMSSEGKLKLLAQYLANHPIFKDTLFIFHGYTGFTPLQYEVLRSLSNQCQDMWFVLTLSSRRKGREYIFNLSIDTIKVLKTLRNNGIFHLKRIDKNNNKTCSSELDYLEENLFSLSRKRVADSTKAIHLKAFMDRGEEIRHIASLIKENIKEKDIRYQDIGVILGDLKGYEPILHRIFDEYDIPYFFDLGEETKVHPMVLSIIYALDIIDNNFSLYSIFKYASLGLTSLSLEEIDNLENYCLSKGMNGKKIWNSNINEVSNKYSEENLESLNRSKNTLINPILELSEFFSRKRYSVGERLEGIYLFLQNIQAAEIGKEKDEYLRKVFPNKDFDSQEILRGIVSVLDQMYQLLGTMYLKKRDFIDVLTAGLLSIQGKAKPPSKDRVIIGDASRTRLDHIHTLFFGGINEGMVIGLGKEGGFITDKDKIFLEEKGIHLSPRGSKEIGTAKFYMYLALTVPSHQLYLSYSHLDQEGKKLQGDYTLKHVQNLFKSISSWEEKPSWSIDDKLKDFVQLWKENNQDKRVLQLIQTLGKEKQYHFLLEKINQGIHSRYIHQQLSEGIINKLYGNKNKINTTVSRLEKFSACPYSYFLKFGLKLKEREILEVAMSDIGSIVHAALEAYGNIALAHNLKWNEVKEEQKRQWIDESLLKAYGSEYDFLFSSSPRYKYLKKQVDRLFQLNLDSLSKQLSYSSLKPIYLEEGFDLELKDKGFPINIYGIIDRVDRLDTSHNSFLNVIDYKTGKKNFDLSLWNGGLQLQLPIYLAAIIQKLSTKDKLFEPGGFFYYQIKEPSLDFLKSDYIHLQKEMRLNGILNEDREFLSAFDHHLADHENWNQSAASLIIPVTIKKDNTLDARSKNTAISAQNIQKILEASKNKVKSIVSDIRNGEHQVRPYQHKNNIIPCTYCEYKGICQINSGISGFQSRLIEDFSLDNL